MLWEYRTMFEFNKDIKRERRKLHDNTSPILVFTAGCNYTL